MKFNNNELSTVKAIHGSKDALVSSTDVAIKILQDSKLESSIYAHHIRVWEAIKQLAISEKIEIAALLHDGERYHFINGYEICELFGPQVFTIITEFAIAIWVEKTVIHERRILSKCFIGDYCFDASTLRNGLVLRTIDWLDNKTEYLSHNFQLPIHQRKIGENFFIPLMDQFGFFSISNQIRNIII